MVHFTHWSKILCRLAIALLAATSLSLSLDTFGSSAWRTFPVWLFALSAGYFLVISALSIIGPGIVRTFSPTFEGSLVVSFALSAIVSLAPGAQAFRLGPLVFILGHVLLPLLILADYLLQSRRSPWRWARPWEFLALPLIYCATMLATSAILPASTPLLFPLNFLNFPSFGFGEMLIALLLLGLCGLLLGYVLQLLATLAVAFLLPAGAGVAAHKVHRRRG